MGKRARRKRPLAKSHQGWVEDETFKARLLIAVVSRCNFFQAGVRGERNPRGRKERKRRKGAWRREVFFRLRSYPCKGKTSFHPGLNTKLIEG